jgi:hypothetical protein
VEQIEKLKLYDTVGVWAEVVGNWGGKRRERVWGEKREEG